MFQLKLINDKFYNKLDNIPHKLTDGPADIFNTFFDSIVAIIVASIHE